MAIASQSNTTLGGRDSAQNPVNEHIPATKGVIAGNRSIETAQATTISQQDAVGNEVSIQATSELVRYARRSMPTEYTDVTRI